MSHCSTSRRDLAFCTKLTGRCTEPEGQPKDPGWRNDVPEPKDTWLLAVARPQWAKVQNA